MGGNSSQVWCTDMDLGCLVILGDKGFVQQLGDTMEIHNLVYHCPSVDLAARWSILATEDRPGVQPPPGKNRCLQWSHAPIDVVTRINPHLKGTIRTRKALTVRPRTTVNVPVTDRDELLDE